MKNRDFPVRYVSLPEGNWVAYHLRNLRLEHWSSGKNWLHNIKNIEHGQNIVESSFECCGIGISTVFEHVITSLGHTISNASHVFVEEIPISFRLQSIYTNNWSRPIW